MQLTFDTLKKICWRGNNRHFARDHDRYAGTLVSKRFHAEAFIEGEYIARGFERA